MVITGHKGVFETCSHEMSGGRIKQKCFRMVPNIQQDLKGFTLLQNILTILLMASIVFNSSQSNFLRASIILASFIVFIFFVFRWRRGRTHLSLPMLGVLVVVHIGLFIGDTSGVAYIISLLAMLLVFVIVAVYVFSLRKYRGTSLKTKYYQGSEYNWRNHKLIFYLFVLPLLLIGLIIIIGIPTLFLYAWLFL